MGEENAKFWKRLLHQYCLEKGEIVITQGMVYQDLTLPFVVPGDPYVYGSSDSIVNVYPESLKQSLEELLGSKEVILSCDVDFTIESLPREEVGGGWFNTVFNALSSQPKKHTMAENTEFVPESILAILATLLLSSLPQVMPSPEIPWVFFLHDTEADKICSKSLEMRLVNGGHTNSSSRIVVNPTIYCIQDL